jgi:hypothetical protein
MKVVILGPWDIEPLSASMNKLIDDSQCFLFTVICGGQDSNAAKSSIGYKWAAKNGAPVEFIIEADLEKLLNKIVQTADYIVAFNDGSQIIKRLIMKFKMEGKHGTVLSR